MLIYVINLHFYIFVIISVCFGYLTQNLMTYKFIFIYGIIDDKIMLYINVLSPGCNLYCIVYNYELYSTTDVVL